MRFIRTINWDADVAVGWVGTCLSEDSLAAKERCSKLARFSTASPLQQVEIPRREVAAYVSRRSGHQGKALAPPSNNEKSNGKAKAEGDFGKGKKNEDSMVENSNSRGSELVDTIRKLQLLPTRLIDIGPGEFIQPRLCTTAGWAVAPTYTALSYCWGDVDHSPLTKVNSEQSKKSIPLSQLSTTIQDAFATAKRQGIRYVWVDILCTLMDDKDDVNLECENEESYYRNSVILLDPDIPPLGVSEIPVDGIRRGEG
jgi:hypothetical protein